MMRETTTGGSISNEGKVKNEASFQLSEHFQHPPLALGTLQWGTTPIDDHLINGTRGVLTEAESRAIFDAFVKRGVVLFDTAEGYGGGTSEKRLARVRRWSLCAPTKTAAMKKADMDGMARPVVFMTKFLPAPWRFTHEHFEEALRASNRRLGISTCPIYLLHSPMHAFRPIEYWVEAAAICRSKGLLDALGLSNCSGEQVERAVLAGDKYGVPIILNQVHYSLLDYNSTSLQHMQSICRKHNIMIVAYNCLGQGLLTDKLTQDSFNQNKPAKMMHIQWDDILPIRNALHRIAEERNQKMMKCNNNDNNNNDNKQRENKVTMAQVAINWCRSHQTIPLVGCRSLLQAHDTLSSLDWELTKDEMMELDALALSRCTLDSPIWRRKLFVGLASVIMVVCQVLDMWGMGMVPRALVGM